MKHFKKQTVLTRPLARQSDLLEETVGDETVLYDLESKEAHCLKALAASVYSYANGQNTTADIADLTSHRLGRPVTETEVADALAQLEQHNLLDVLVLNGDGVSRREAIRRIAATGVGAALGASLITTIVAPTALAAGSNIPTGNCCGNSATSTCEGLNHSCAQNHCCQNNGGKQCNQCKCVGVKNDCEVVSSGCTVSPNSCPAGQECVNTSAGTVCCTVVTTQGGGVINC